MATATVTPAPAAPAAPVTPAAAPATPAPNATLGELVQQSITPIASPEAPPAEPAAPATQPAATPEGTPAAPVAEPAQPEQTPVDAADQALEISADDLEVPSTDADGKRMFLTKTKWGRLHKAGKFVQDLTELMGTVTPEGVKGAIEKASAATAMMQKFQEGAINPEAIREVVNVFGGFDNPTPQDKQSFGVMALEMLGRLPQMNPQVFNHVVSVHHDYTINQLRQNARQTVDPEQRAQAVALALSFEKAIKGNYTPSAQWLNGTAMSQEQMERAQFERDRKAFQDQQRQEAQNKQQQWAGYVGQQIDDARREAVEAAFPEAVRKSPYWNAMHQEIGQKIAEAELAHKEWEIQFDNLLKDCILNPGEAALNAAKRFRKDIAARIARANAPAIVEKYSALQQQQNADAHARGANAANEPSPTGAPAPLPNGGLQAAINDPDLSSSIKKLFAGTAA